MAINSVLPAPKIFRNDYSKLQSHRTVYKCILSRCDAVIDEIAAAKIDGKLLADTRYTDPVMAPLKISMGLHATD